MTARLPVTLTPQPGQALDCYLEHVAAANGMTTAALTTALGGRAVTPVVGLLAPSRLVTRRLADLTGLAPAHLRATTIAAYAGGRPLDLTGLDPDRPDTYRILATRGWMPGQGTQICPDCLATTGVWQLRWRLPTTTVCPTHRRYLTATCGSCRRPFRAQRQSPPAARRRRHQLRQPDRPRAGPALRRRPDRPASCARHPGMPGPATSPRRRRRRTRRRPR